MAGKIDFGIYIPQLQFSFDDIRARVDKAEELGYRNVWFMDHLYPPFLPDVPSFEAWTLASALAPITSTIRLGHLVLDNAFRHPALVAKMASSLDVISGGRLELGLGTGSYPREHPEYGIHFPGARERTERLEESIDIIKLLFTQERTTFKGKFFELEDAPLLPKSVQSPHPPIWIGGAGPKLTLPLAARKADVWNAPTGAAAVVEEKIELLKAECAKIGRDPATLQFTLEAVLVIVPTKADLPDALAASQPALRRPRLRRRGRRLRRHPRHGRPPHRRSRQGRRHPLHLVLPRPRPAPLHRTLRQRSPPRLRLAARRPSQPSPRRPFTTRTA